MYTQDDLTRVSRMLKRRSWIAIAPAAVMLVAAIVVFIVGRLQRSDQMWMVTAALTVLGGAYFLFFYGVSVRPVRIYQKHVNYMLNGRKRETTGILKAFADDMNDKDGLDCYAMLVNVGDRDDGEDDRLFYYDAHIPRPDIPLGTRVTVVSNDKMVASIKLA